MATGRVWHSCFSLLGGGKASKYAFIGRDAQRLFWGSRAAKWIVPGLESVRSLSSGSETPDTPRVLITGGLGQLGRGLAEAMR